MRCSPAVDAELTWTLDLDTNSISICLPTLHPKLIPIDCIKVIILLQPITSKYISHQIPNSKTLIP